MCILYLVNCKLCNFYFYFTYYIKLSLHSSLAVTMYISLCGTKKGILILKTFSQNRGFQPLTGWPLLRSYEHQLWPVQPKNDLPSWTQFRGSKRFNYQVTGKKKNMIGLKVCLLQSHSVNHLAPCFCGSRPYGGEIDTNIFHQTCKVMLCKGSDAQLPKSNGEHRYFLGCFPRIPALHGHYELFGSADHFAETVTSIIIWLLKERILEAVLDIKNLV